MGGAFSASSSEQKASATMDGLGVVYEQEEPLAEAAGAAARPEDDEELRALAQDPDAALAGSGDAQEPRQAPATEQPAQGGGGYDYQAQAQQVQQAQEQQGQGQGQGGYAADAGRPIAKLFVGGVAWDTTEETLRGYFGKYGALTDAALMKDKYTGQPRGFGFVTFADPAGRIDYARSCHSRLESDGLVAWRAAIDRVLEEAHTLDGRSIEVKRAIPRDRTAPGHRLVLRLSLAPCGWRERKEEQEEKEKGAGGTQDEEEGREAGRKEGRDQNQEPSTAPFVQHGSFVFITQPPRARVLRAFSPPRLLLSHFRISFGNFPPPHAESTSNYLLAAPMNTQRLPRWRWRWRRRRRRWRWPWRL